MYFLLNGQGGKYKTGLQVYMEAWKNDKIVITGIGTETGGYPQDKPGHLKLFEKYMGVPIDQLEKEWKEYILRLNPNQTVNMLFSIYDVQTMFKEDDLDKNDKHDYGTLTALYRTGLVSFDTALADKLLLKGYATASSGYYVAVYLPQEPDLVEKHWCAFAWPKTYGNDSYPTYFINEQGKVLETNEPLYDDKHNGPKLADVFTGKSFVSPINTKKWLPEGKVRKVKNEAIYFWSLLVVALITAEVISKRRRKNMVLQKGRGFFQKYDYGYNIVALVCFGFSWAYVTYLSPSEQQPDFFIITLNVLGIFFSYLGIDNKLYFRILNIFFNGIVSLLFIGSIFALFGVLPFY
jgi:hypothetical protein